MVILVNKARLKMEYEVEECTMRPMHCELNVLTRPDGSAMLTQGNTAVVAAVYGPVEVKPQKIKIDKASVEAIYRPKSGLPNVTDRMREALLRNTCETAIVATLHPRTSICLIIQEMQDSGSLLACCVNAACLAVMNSGLAMKFLVAGVTCMIDKNDEILFDPDDKQLQEGKASLTFVFENTKKNIVASHTSGNFTQTQYQECLLKCSLLSDKIFEFYRDVVKKYANRI